ncbi:MAG: four helix bundle protein [Gemmataceae bacterium]|nr:four helix bundle protein [Gemmataceae bacterium]
MKGDDIAARLLDFAVRVIRMVSELPKNQVGKHVGGQILRCGTSSGANYEEARGGQSRADFIHRLSISWREMRESCYWLKLTERAQLVKPTRMQNLLREGLELSAILGKSLSTAKRKTNNGS